MSNHILETANCTIFTVQFLILIKNLADKLMTLKLLVHPNKMLILIFCCLKIVIFSIAFIYTWHALCPCCCFFLWLKQQLLVVMNQFCLSYRNSWNWITLAGEKILIQIIKSHFYPLASSPSVTVNEQHTHEFKVQTEFQKLSGSHRLQLF